MFFSLMAGCTGAGFCSWMSAVFAYYSCCLCKSSVFRLRSNTHLNTKGWRGARWRRGVRLRGARCSATHPTVLGTACANVVLDLSLLGPLMLFCYLQQQRALFLLTQSWTCVIRQAQVRKFCQVCWNISDGDKQMQPQPVDRLACVQCFIASSFGWWLNIRVGCCTNLPPSVAIVI